jgi:hypothetical protein
VSAQSSNDTFNNEDTPGISSGITSSMAMNTSKADTKNCVLQIKKIREITQVIELSKSDLVNIIDLHLIFGTRSNKKLFADIQISLVSPIGREILYTLDKERYNRVTWTLNAGRKNFNLHVKENPKECKRDLYDFITANILKKIVLREKNPTNYEICYRNRRMCCRITEPDLTNFTYECVEIDSFLHKSSFLWILTTLMIGLFPIYLVRLLYMLLSYSVFDQNYPQYHKLQESTMSPSSIFLKIIWKEQGGIACFFRRLLLICALSSIVYFCVKYSVLGLAENIVVRPFIFLIYIAFCLYFVIVRKNHTFKSFENEECVGVVSPLTLPFNIKFLRDHDKLNKVKDFMLKTPSEASESFGEYACYLIKMPFCLLVICLVIPVVFILSYFYVLVYEMANIFSLIIIFDENTKKKNKYRYPKFFPWFDFLTTIVFLTFLFDSCYILVFVIQSLLLGLVLNLIYFIPYLASFFVLTFYCHGYWKSLEKKYFVLKHLIYEACRDKQDDNVDLKENEKLLSVVSTELYENIREKLLPYHTNLFWISLKMLWSFVFSYGIYELVNMLHTFNTTAAVQVVTTASVGVLPYIFNMVSWKNSAEERKEAWKEEMKLNVKRSVGQVMKEIAKITTEIAKITTEIAS